jgi:hypothetical protein
LTNDSDRDDSGDRADSVDSGDSGGGDTGNSDDSGEVVVPVVLEFSAYAFHNASRWRVIGFD